jgi:hypothetical protein
LVERERPFDLAPGGGLSRIGRLPAGAERHAIARQHARHAQRDHDTGALCDHFTST